MESCRSPREVMVLAYRLACAHLPLYSSRFSRKDCCTLPQLFACLILREFYHLSYRRLEALLKDSGDLCRAIGITKAPDHNTLCDAFDTLARMEVFAPMLDDLVRAFAGAGLLKLDEKPLAMDSTHFESHHVSRHFAERRRHGQERDAKRKAKLKAKRDAKRHAKRDAKRVGKSERSRASTKRAAAKLKLKLKSRSKSKSRSKTVSNLPKLGIAVASECHLILSMWSGTGMGSDHPHFPTLIDEACRRAPEVNAIVADAGYDAEPHHVRAWEQMNRATFIPPLTGRPSDAPPTQKWRALMEVIWDHPIVKEIYGQRWQAETTNSMMKRNYGSALRAKTAERREREMLLKAMTHNIAV